MDHPTFAVVGHPNKGKSSIVSTLAHDDRVAIDAIPGTTTRCHAMPMKVDGRTLYTLIDTPGFQRARAALAWMREHETTADKHAQVVAEFVATHRDSGRFVDECELLSPLIDGAGILYVVDGSTRYGPEYEAEMEILRWTGCPRMALINPIGEANHIDEWRAALDQFFSVVHVFNAMTAQFDKQLDLLRAFGQLKDAWRKPLEDAANHLAADRSRRQRLAAIEISELIDELVSLQVHRDLKAHENPEPYKDALAERFRARVRRRERASRAKIEQLYDHHKVQREEAAADVEVGDLFSPDNWYLWGLSRAQLAATSAVGGAMVGATVDLALSAGTFMTGSLIGAAAGGAGAWFGADRLANYKILRQPLGGRRLRYGPVKNVNFLLYVVGRAMAHHQRITQRTHAHRGALRIEGEFAMDDERKKRLAKLFTQLQRGRDVRGELVDELDTALGQHKS
jgi:GTPase Era involved in 16S rRNA processing